MTNQGGDDDEEGGKCGEAKGVMSQHFYLTYLSIKMIKTIIRIMKTSLVLFLQGGGTSEMPCGFIAHS